MVHVGIDLGTTFSLIARVDAHGIPVLFPDRHEAERFKTPSVVHIGPEGALVGQAVEELLEDAPALPVARFAKLSMGREEPIFLDHLGRAWHPEAISALVLKKLARDVAAYTDEAIDGAILSVPAHFNDPQREATRQAGELAGLNVIDLVEEPLAAATHYGAHAVQPDKTILVYDLGGGTFDATVLHVGPEGLYALATDGASDLGGKNFDEAIMAMVADQFRLAHHYDPLQDPIVSGQLRRQAEAMKIKLAMPGQSAVRKALLLGGRAQEIFLTRGHFDQAIRPLIDRSLAVCARALKAAGLEWAAIDQVLMAGGSTLVPAVEAAIRLASNLHGDRVKRHQPHMAIAYGAALIAAQRTGSPAGEAPRLLQRVSGFDLGCRVFDPVTRKPAVDTLLARNTPIPAHRTITYYTNRADQARIILDVVQVKAPDEPAISLGQFAFPVVRPRKNHPLEIAIGYDEHGMVSVVARDPETKHEVKRDFSGSAHPQGRFLEQQALLETVTLCD
jgi:molecular chaperone DnaK